MADDGERSEDFATITGYSQLGTNPQSNECQGRWMGTCTCVGLEPSARPRWTSLTCVRALTRVLVLTAACVVTGPCKFAAGIWFAQ